MPWTSLHAPREPLNPITAAATGLGHALRLWRDASPLREGGTIILLHDFRRTFGHGPQAPYRDLFHVLREGVTPEQLAAARDLAAADPRALAAYRQGHAPHPLLPYVDWASCAPALARAGTVLVAGCRDAGAARALGLVPTHNISTALEMARGVAGGSHRIGVLLAPPYVPLIVGDAPSLSTGAASLPRRPPLHDVRGLRIDRRLDLQPSGHPEDREPDDRAGCIGRVAVCVEPERAQEPVRHLGLEQPGRDVAARSVRLRDCVEHDLRRLRAVDRARVGRLPAQVSGPRTPS